MPNENNSDLPVILNYSPLGIIRGRTISISDTGVLVDTNVIYLNKNEQVDIAILYPNGLVRRLDTTVLSSSEYGTALSFNSQQTKLPGSDPRSAIQAA